jgi:hypothetical protein
MPVKSPKDAESYFFGDESGDPTFYDSRGRCVVGRFGCSPILIVGFIETQEPRLLRKAVLDLHEKVRSDPFLNKLRSARKTAIAFHAKDDAPEVRYLFSSLMHQLTFKAQIVVARKDEQIFRENYRCKEKKFYDDLLTKLFERVLHRFKHNEIIFAARGSRARKKPLEKAIWRAKGRFEQRYNVSRDLTTFSIRPQRLSGEPCLSIADYMTWAVYRAIVNDDSRYYDLLSSKISFLETRFVPEMKHVYCRKNPLDVRAVPPGLGS